MYTASEVVSRLIDLADKRNETLGSIYINALLLGLNIKLKDGIDIEIPELDRIDREGYVYFMLSGNMVKIGRTKKNPEHRIRYAKNQSHKPTEIIAWMYVSDQRFFEELCHKTLDKYRVVNEWFEYNEDVLSIVLPSIFCVAQMQSDVFLTMISNCKVGNAISLSLKNLSEVTGGEEFYMYE